MNIAQIILGAVVIVLAVVVMVIVMIQQGKNDGLGAMAGGSAMDAESYYNKNKNKTKDALLNKITVVASILLVAAVIVLNLLVK